MFGSPGSPLLRAGFLYLWLHGLLIVVVSLQSTGSGARRRE